MVMSPMMQTLGPIVTSSSMTGDFKAPSNPLAPMVVFCLKETFLPMIVPGLITEACAEWNSSNPSPICVDEGISHPKYTLYIFYRLYSKRNHHSEPSNITC